METAVTELLVAKYWEQLKRASFVNAKTLRRLYPHIVVVELPTKRDDNWETRAMEIITSGLRRSLENGVPSIVVEPGSWTPLPQTFLEKLKDAGLVARNIGTSRHRHCPHSNGWSRRCHYDDDPDGGAGEITEDLWIVSISFAKLGEYK